MSKHLALRSDLRTLHLPLVLDIEVEVTIDPNVDLDVRGSARYFPHPVEFRYLDLTITRESHPKLFAVLAAECDDQEMCDALHEQDAGNA